VNHENHRRSTVIGAFARLAWRRSQLSALGRSGSYMSSRYGAMTLVFSCQWH